jgi:osmotically-inducible protein OsmY
MSSWFEVDDGRVQFGARPGDQTGRGPTGYHRPDDSVREEIVERLVRDPWIDATDVEVRVKDRVVTLDGVLADRRQRRMAEDVAWSVYGVENVNNEIHVNDHRATGDRRQESHGTFWTY